MPPVSISRSSDGFTSYFQHMCMCVQCRSTVLVVTTKREGADYLVRSRRTIRRFVYPSQVLCWLLLGTRCTNYLVSREVAIPVRIRPPSRPRGHRVSRTVG